MDYDTASKVGAESSLGVRGPGGIKVPKDDSQRHDRNCRKHDLDQICGFRDNTHLKRSKHYVYLRSTNDDEGVHAALPTCSNRTMQSMQNAYVHSESLLTYQ